MRNIRPMTPEEVAKVPAIAAITGGGRFGYCDECDGLRSIDENGLCVTCKQPLPQSLTPATAKLTLEILRNDLQGCYVVPDHPVTSGNPAPWLMHQMRIELDSFDAIPKIMIRGEHSMWFNAANCLFDRDPSTLPEIAVDDKKRTACFNNRRARSLRPFFETMDSREGMLTWLLQGVMHWLAKMDMVSREGAIKTILTVIESEYCLHCGSDFGGACNCQRDE